MELIINFTETEGWKVKVTAGPKNETHELFGVLTPVPKPETYAMLLAGLSLLGVMPADERVEVIAMQ